MTTGADPSDMPPPPLSTPSATRKIAFFRVLKTVLEIPDDDLLFKVLNYDGIPESMLDLVKRLGCSWTKRWSKRLVMVITIVAILEDTIRHIVIVARIRSVVGSMRRIGVLDVIVKSLVDWWVQLQVGIKSRKSDARTVDNLSRVICQNPVGHRVSNCLGESDEVTCTLITHVSISSPRFHFLVVDSIIEFELVYHGDVGCLAM